MKVIVDVPDQPLVKMSETLSFLCGKIISPVDAARHFAQYLVNKNFAEKNLDCESIIANIQQEAALKKHNNL